MYKEKKMVAGDPKGRRPGNLQLYGQFTPQGVFKRGNLLHSWAGWGEGGGALKSMAPQLCPPAHGAITCIPVQSDMKK